MLVLTMTVACAPPATADPLPVNWVMTPGHVGFWADGMTTTNHPTDLSLSRSATSNELSWNAPLFSDGRTLVGYYVYRLPGDAQLDPVTSFYVTTGTSLSDTTADPTHPYVYMATAEFQDASTGQFTQSLPGNVAVAFAGGYPHCMTPQYNLAVFPYVFVDAGCIIP